MGIDSDADIFKKRNCLTQINRRSHPISTLNFFFRLHKYLEPIIYTSIVAFGVIVLIQTYFFLRLRDGSLIKKCIPFYCCCVFAMCMNVLCLYLINSVKPLDQETTIFLKTFLYIELNPKIQKRLERLNLKFRLYCVIFATIFITSMMINSYFILMKVDVFIPLPELLRTLNYECSVIIVTCLLMYIIFLLNFEALLLIDNVYKRGKELKVIDYKKEDHNAAFVKSQLTKIVMEHLRMKCNSDAIVETNKMVSFLTLSTGLLGGFLSLITVVLNVLPPLNGLLFFSAFFICCYLLSDLAQDYSNIGENLVEAIHSLNWYQWNIENQKMYLTAIVNFSKNITITLYSTFTIGNDLFKTICHISYSFISCVYTLEVRKAHSDIA